MFRIFCLMIATCLILQAQESSSQPRVNRLASVDGCVTYSLPRGAEVTISWPQFHGSSNAIQYEVSLPDGTIWRPSYGADSHGQGFYGTGFFSSVRVSKTPFEDVRVSIRNDGENRSYILLPHTTTTESLPLTDDVVGALDPRSAILAGENLLQCNLDAKKNLLVITYPTPPKPLPEIKSKSCRLSAFNGHVIYSMPFGAEVTLSWQQFLVDSAAIQYDVVLPEGQSWAPNWGSTSSHGVGEYGVGMFSSFRASKDPYAQVRASIRNDGKSRSYILKSHSRTTAVLGLSDGKGQLPDMRAPMEPGETLLKFYLDAEKRLLVVTYPVPTVQVPASPTVQYRPSVSLPGCLIYDIPQQQEVTMKWPQYHAGSSAIQYEVATGDWSVWGPNWGSTVSHGVGERGSNVFSSFRASKDPFVEVRGSVRNDSQNVIYHLMRTSGTNGPLPIQDSVQGYTGNRRQIASNDVLLSYYLMGEQNRLIVVYPDDATTGGIAGANILKTKFPTSVVASKGIVRVAPVAGCLVYNLPRDKEMTLKWKQFLPNSQCADGDAIQYGVYVNKGAAWTPEHPLRPEDGGFWSPNWGSTVSHGLGEWGQGDFSCFRASKDPYGDVRATVVNKGTDIVYHLISYTTTAVSFPLRDSLGNLQNLSRRVENGKIMMSFHLLGSQDRLVVVYPSIEPAVQMQAPQIIKPIAIANNISP